MTEQLIPVRILYTVSGSPQYMLARSLSPAKVSRIQTANPSICYGRTRLDVCISAINRSSPELFNDDELDYSMYLLDPLESQLPSTSTASTSVQSLQGVAVGLGLMSNLTEFSEEIFVTGTVSKGQVGIDSLEVVFNLRELKRKAKPIKQQKKRAVSRRPEPPRDQPYPTLAGLHSSTVVNVDPRHRYYPTKAELYSTEYLRATSLAPPPPLSQHYNNPPPVHSSQTPSLQSLLSVLSSAENQDAVLSMLSLIDAKKISDSGSSPSLQSNADPALSEALRNLLTAAAYAPTSQVSHTANSIPQTSSSAPNSQDPFSPSSADESAPSSTPTDSCTPSSSQEPMKVNKENVKPISTSKSMIDAEKLPSCSSSQFSRTPSFSSPPRSRLRNVAGNAAKNKRNHQEMLGENEPRRERTISATTVGQDGRLDMEFVRHRLQELSSQAHSEPGNGWTYSTFQSSDWATAKVKDARLVAAAGSSSPAAGLGGSGSGGGSSLRAVATNSAGTKKRFVVPDWAKTETATVPRLSEDAAAKIKLEKEKVAPAAKSKVARKAKDRRRKSGSGVPAQDQTDHTQSEPAMKRPTTPKRKIVKAARSSDVFDLPIIASSSMRVFQTSPLASHSSSMMSHHSKPPKTPTRKRNSSPDRTPRRSSLRATSMSPLFTPGSANCTTPKLPSLLDSCSPLFRGRSSPPEVRRSSSSKTSEDEDRLMNSLPGASSDFEEEAPPIVPMKVFSSSPPPSSPILTSSDDESLLPTVTMGLPPGGVPQSGGVEPDFMQDFGWLSDNACSNQTFQDFEGSELMELMKGHQEGTDLGSSSSTASDDDARFANEIFDWTSADESGAGDGFQLEEFWNSVKPLMEETVEPGDLHCGGGTKLAGEMVDLFGGCLM